VRVQAPGWGRPFRGAICVAMRPDQGHGAQRPCAAKRTAPSRHLAAIVCALALLLRPVPARGQDFASPTPPALIGTPAIVLERGLPAEQPALAAEAVATSWYGMPDLATRALALGAGWRSIRGAAGISRTGGDELGWTTAALALGVAARGAGAALRVAARRDCVPAARDEALGPGAGLEAGGGAWVEAGAGITLSTSAPQIFTRGVAPPLERGLEIGASWVMDDLSIRLTRVSARGGAGAAQHEAGLALSAGPVTVWLEARDLPARGTLGLSARARALTVAGAVESHPVLGQTVRLSLAISGSQRTGDAFARPERRLRAAP